MLDGRADLPGHRCGGTEAGRGSAPVDDQSAGPLIAVDAGHQVEHYFGKFNKFRNDRWVFGDRDSGACLVKFSWTAIERHAPVKGTASPDDPALAGYWAKRRTKVKPPVDNYTLRPLSRQAGCCPLCGDHLLTPDQPPQSPQQWERWWLQVARQAIAASYLAHDGHPGPGRDDHTRLVHAAYQRGLIGRQRRKPGTSTAPPARLA